jgi:hypothetical protein
MRWFIVFLFIAVVVIRLFATEPTQTIKYFHNKLAFPVIIMLKPCLQETPNHDGCLIESPLWVLPRETLLYGHITQPNETSKLIVNSRLIARIWILIFSEIPGRYIVTHRDLANGFSDFPNRLYEITVCSNLNASTSFDIAKKLNSGFYCDTSGEG